MSTKMSIDDSARSMLLRRPSKDASVSRDSVSSGNDVFQDMPSLDLKTIREIISGKDTKANIVTSTHRIASLNYLSSFLDLRGRLQELGAVFSPSSEPVAYGNPTSHREFEEMLTLGPIYEEQWNMFFVEYRTAELQGTADMWPDLRTLKKILSNHGILFGIAHLRLNCSDSSDSLMRLCEAYDELRKQWLAMMELRLPSGDDYELQDLRNSCSGEGYVFDDSLKLLIDVARVGRSYSFSSDRRNYKPRSSDVPTNLGWRFSDDIEVKSKDIEWDVYDNKMPVRNNVDGRMDHKPEPASEADSSYLTNYEVFESQLRLAARIILPLSRPVTPIGSTISPQLCLANDVRQVCSSEQSPSSSQELLTLMEALEMTPSSYSIQENSCTLVVYEEKPIAFYRGEQRQAKIKWRPWTWLREVLGHNKQPKGYGGNERGAF